MATKNVREGEHQVGDKVVSPDGRGVAMLVKDVQKDPLTPGGTPFRAVTYEVTRGVIPAGAGEAEAVRSRRVVVINVPPAS